MEDRQEPQIARDGATVTLMPRAVTAVDPGPRPDDRPARRGRGARGASTGPWATATDDPPGFGDTPDGPQSPASAAGTGWPADIPPRNED